MMKSSYTTDEILMAFPIQAAGPDVSHIPGARSGPRVEPEPLYRELPPAAPYPVEALGPHLAPATQAIHDVTKAPLAICAQSVLATATLAVQPHADVVLPNGQACPVSEYFATVAASGERKTACDREANWPVRKREAALKRRYDRDLLAYDMKKAAWDRQQKQILSDKKSYPDQKSKTKALEALGPPPERPLQPTLTCPDPTIEGLWKALANGQPSMGVFAHEGGQFVGSHGMSRDNRIHTVAGYSALWDGEPVKVVRASGISVLANRRVTMHLMMQPDVSRMLLSDPLLTDQGLLSRFLIVAPASLMGLRAAKEPAPESIEEIRAYGKRVLDILEASLPVEKETVNELKPRHLPLSPKAKSRLIKFQNEIESRLSTAGDLRDISGLANKLPEHAARIAAVLALFEHLDRKQILIQHIRAGIELARHYASEALRLNGAGRANPSLMQAEALRVWLLESWQEPLISLPDIYRRGPNPIRDRKTAQTAVEILVQHGWLEKVPGGGVVSGEKRQQVWQIVRPPH